MPRGPSLSPNLKKNGGRKPGAGRPRNDKGQMNGSDKSLSRARTRELANWICDQGQSPLLHLYKVWTDEEADVERRDRAAIAALSYVHPRLNAIALESKAETVNVTRIELVGVVPEPKQVTDAIDFVLIEAERE